MQNDSTARHETLDVRAMEPPQPLERILTLVDGFKPGDTLKVIIDCTPLPLFRILDRDGFAYRVEPGTQSVHEITIWRADR